MIKKFISIFLCLSLFTTASCAGGKAGSVSASTLPDNQDAYAPVPEAEIAPLLAVEAVTAEHTTGPAPLLVPTGQTFVAPSASLCFTLEVSSFILAESESVEARYNASLITQRELDMSRLRLSEESWRIRINSERERFLIVHRGDLAEISRLMGLVKSSMETSSSFPWVTVLVSAGSILLGIVIGAIVEYITLR